MKKDKKKKLWWNAEPHHPKETFRNELTKLETKKEVWWDVRYFTVLSASVHFQLMNLPRSFAM
jgi:hypothetical protein